MRYLFSHWESVIKKLKRAPHRLLLFDFDGTLSALTPTPRQARLQPGIRRLLAKLARSKTCSVGIVSGRSLKEIRSRVGLQGMIYVGNHGLEAQNGHGRWIHPIAHKNKAALHSLARHLRKALHPITGVLVEDKGVTLSVHFRGVKPGERPHARRVVRQILKGSAFANDFAIRPGNHVLEILPRLNWGKGTAVQILRERSPEDTVLLYAGDDATDEAAFRVVRPEGIAVRIGSRHGSQAPYYLRGQREMKRLLERLVNL